MNGYDFWAAVCLLIAGLCCFHWLWRASEPDDPTDVWGDDVEDAIAEALAFGEKPLYDAIAANSGPGLVAEVEAWLREVSR